MKFNFKKIVSVLTSTVMLGSTVALAAAANYPAPFVSGGKADVAIVYGSTSATTDLVAAVDIESKLSSEIVRQAVVPSGGVGTAVSSSGGDSINLASSSQRLYMNSSINAAKTTLSLQDLPNLLADGISTDQAGVQYKYNQKMILSPTTTISFTKSGESIDPIPVLDIGSASNLPILNYTLTFTKIINVSDTTNVAGVSSVKVLGKEFVIGANSDSNTLYLYGSGQSATVEEGESQTVTIADKEHAVVLKGTTSTTAATVSVDGVQKSVNKGSSYKFPGDFEVYVKDIYHATKTGTLSNVVLLLGAKTLHFEDGQVVRYGADDTSLTGTIANVSGTAGQGISALTIAQSYKDGTGDYVKIGESFTDRVLDGAFKVNFAKITPALSEEGVRDKIVVDTDNSIAAKITFPYPVNGKSVTLSFARDPDGSADGTLSRLNLATDNNYTLSVQEGENLSLNSYVIVNNADKPRVLKLTNIPTATSASDVVTFEDTYTSDKFNFNTGTVNTSSYNIDGQTYYVATSALGSGGSANLTWGAGASAGSIGTQRTLFPRIKLSGGSWFTILASTNITNLTMTYQLPGVDSLTTYESGSVLGSGNGSINTTAVGKIAYSVNWTGWSSSYNGSGVLNNVTIGGIQCVFNSTLGPAILIQEEKTTTGGGSTNGEVHCIPLTREGTDTIKPAVSTTIVSSESSNLLASRTLQTASTKAQGVSIFGTLLETDTTDSNIVKAWIPTEQMFADVLVTAPETTVIGTNAGTGSGVSEVTTAVRVTDSEITSVSTKNLIVVGGSCINTVAAKLLGSNTALCGADFTTKTGAAAGQYVIESFESPYAAGKVATLVAGYSAQDTSNAAKYLITQTVDTTKGKKYVGTTETTAELQVAASGAGTSPAAA